MYVYNAKPEVQDMYGFISDVKNQVSLVIADVAWLTMDEIPRVYCIIVDHVESMRSFTFQDLADYAVESLQRLETATIKYFRSFYQCPREETLFFVWSYPQTYYCSWYNAHYGHYRVLSRFDQRLLLVLVTIALTAVAWLVFKTKYALRAVRLEEDVAHTFSRWLFGRGFDMWADYKTSRVVFQTTPIPVQSPYRDHSHGACAATRSTASCFMRNVISAFGLVPWVYQMSANDQNVGLRGLRTAFWTKDLTSAPRSDAMTNESAVMMVDVDYYVDMPRWLAVTFRPHLLYTFQPQTAGRVAKEYAYSFTNDLVEYCVTGGGRYEHPVWNYQQDAISTTRYLFGVPICRSTYLVERRKAGGDHEIIMLLPLKTWGIMTAWISWLFVQEAPLKQFAMQAGAHNRLRIHDDSGVFVSTSRIGSTCSITIPIDIDEEILTVARLGKLDIAYPTVAQILAAHEMENQQGSKILTEFARSKIRGGDRRACVPMIQHYQVADKRYDPDAKNSLVSFMSPIALPPCAPQISILNEEYMVRGRVTEIQNKEIPLSIKMDNLINEFVEILIPDRLARTFGPMDRDYLLEKQNRPSQRRILAAAEFDCSATPLLHGFMKKEPKLECNEPRPIVTFEGDTKAGYSEFIYTLADYLKTQEWYAFGQAPLGIAKKIAAMAMDAQCATSSDGSRWDGRVSSILRTLETRVLTRMFAPQYQKEVHRLHQKQYSRAVRTTLGAIYELLYSRGSGSPETSAFNGVENKFIAYVAHRNAGVPPNEAFHKAGIYGGDDGVTFDMDADTLVAAAASVGQKYSSETSIRGESIKFLSRFYSPRVWFGAVDSACDLDRTLRSFNATVRMAPNVTPVMKLIEKCRAYALSDPNTPVIGDLALAVMEVNEGDFYLPDRDLRPITTWNSMLDKELQYPNNVADEDLSWMNLAPGFDLYEFRAWIDEIRCSDASKVNKLARFLTPPYCDSRQIPVTAKIEVVVNDALIPAVKVPSQPRPDPVYKDHAKKYIPCPSCSDKGRKNRHSAEQCWNDLSPLERKKKQEALKNRAPHKKW